MKDEFAIACNEVKDKLKPFLEDMLAEEEYQAFVAHIENCSKCRDYVRSIGALSNQLWKLGDVEVPSDFVSTVIFNLKHPKPGAPLTTRPTISKKLTAGIIVSIFIIASLFLGIAYFKKFKVSQEVPETPIVTNQIIIEQKSPGGREAEMLLEKLKGIKEALGPVQKEKSVEKPPTVTGLSASNEITIVEPIPLHWHFLYTEEVERRKLIDAFNNLGISPDYKTADLCFFNAIGKKIDTVIEQIVAISKQETPLRDFTAGTQIFTDKERRVSIFFEKQKTAGSNSLHWHISFILPQEKVKLIDIIQSMYGSIDYELEEIIVFSIPKTEVKKLKKRIQVMDVMFSEFGKLESKEGQLSSIPVKISIYFQRGK